MYDFTDLFIFEMANNHQGSVEHGIKIIKEMGRLTKKYNLKAGVKLQFRHYDTFIHPEMLENKDNPKIKRFLSTRLSDQEHSLLVQEIRKNEMITIVTPFDERSVDLAQKLDIEIIKIGSPSLYDFSLIQKIKKTGKPVIFSSGGCDIDQVDKIYNIFDGNCAIMHCVSIYPTPLDQLNLSTISTFKDHFDTTIGFSTHESPSELLPIKMAYASGARMFEKHVGVETDEIKLNKYSATPDQVEQWILSYLEAKEIMGKKRVISEKEKEDLNLLYRGVFFSKDIEKGQKVTEDDIYFAFPINPQGILTGDFKSFTAKNDYSKDDYVPKDCNTIDKYMKKVNKILDNNKICIPELCERELSHHQGIDNIFKVGCFIATIVNNDSYCSKIIVITGDHPSHHHKQKDETFFILGGSMKLLLDEKEQELRKGDIVHIPKLCVHSFSTEEGCVFQEISTQHLNDDSYYQDSEISKLSREDRKTFLS